MTADSPGVRVVSLGGGRERDEDVRLQEVDPGQRVDELVHGRVLDGHGRVADHGAQEGPILHGVGGAAARHQRHDSDPCSLGVEQRCRHAGHLAVEPEGEEEAGVARHHGGDPAVVRIERRGEVLGDLDGALARMVRARIAKTPESRP